MQPAIPVRRVAATVAGAAILALAPPCAAAATATGGATGDAVLPARANPAGGEHVGAPPRTRPTVGLVLGGGGARGAAHIGVLEVLESLRVPVDCIAGTSFGALVAGAWAAGVSPRAMRDAMARADWADIFRDEPEDRELAARQRRLLQRYLPGSEIGVGAGGVRGRTGAVTGQKIKLFIGELIGAERGAIDIAALPLPLSIVATDIGSGERVVFRAGDLGQAMRASMSVPALMAPLEVDGRKLVDGGLVDNLPVDEVRERCAPDVVIAVNVGSPLLPPDEVGSLLTVSAQMVLLLTEQNVTRSLTQLGARDIYLRPRLDGIGADGFALHAQAIERGREAAGWVRHALQPLALDEPAWQHWKAARARPSEPPSPVAAVEVAGLQRVHPRAVTRHLNQAAGEPLDTAGLHRDLLRAYGDGWYESVDYRLVGPRERQILRVTPIEKPWGPDYLRFALNLDTTLRQGSTYSLRAAYQRTWLDALGAEAIVGAELGSRTGVDLGWTQPLEPAQRWFGELELASGWAHSDLFNRGLRAARYQVFRSTAALALGHAFARLGELRLGWRETVWRGKLETGSVLLPAGRQYVGGLEMSLDLDHLNRLHFPTEGWALTLDALHSRKGDFTRLGTEARVAWSSGPWVLAARARFSGSPRGRLPIFEAGQLGGFLNLSAYASGQIVADTVRYAQLRGERIVGRMPLGLRGDMRLGLALEAARAGGRFTELDRDGLIDSLAIYLGGETPLGPAYVGLGLSSQGRANAYLFVGTP